SDEISKTQRFKAGAIFRSGFLNLNLRDLSAKVLLPAYYLDDARNALYCFDAHWQSRRYQPARA
ncbi:hypothetical protein OFC55_39625, partial [Escherichia coli]|nr:hypothetical protein [Escherichia coli]